MKDAKGHGSNPRGAMAAHQQGIFNFTPSIGTREARVGHSNVTYGVGHDQIAELTLLETGKRFRNQGSASAALDAFNREADQAGVTTKVYAMPTDPTANPERLRGLYERHGFRITAAEPNAWGRMGYRMTRGPKR